MLITLDIKWGKDLTGHQSSKKYKEFGVVGYADSSYAGDLEDRKLISRYYFLLIRAIITLYSK